MTASDTGIHLVAEQCALVFQELHSFSQIPHGPRVLENHLGPSAHLTVPAHWKLYS